MVIRILKKHKLGVTLHKKVPGFSTALGELKAWCAVCIVSVFSAQFVIITHFSLSDNQDRIKATNMMEKKFKKTTTNKQFIILPG